MRARTPAACAAAGALLVLSAPPVQPAAVGAEPDRACVVGTPPPELEVPPVADRGHGLATGSGVIVAVIDTGVADHPRLGGVVPGADLVTPGTPDPLRDCDGHGTVVAGVIAARPSEQDALVGVAPGARIVSVRQSSAHYRSPAGPGATGVEREGSGTLGGLARAIHEALDHGARVINASVVACVEPRRAAVMDTSSLDEALARAEAEGAVVVAAAGNASADCPEGSVVYPGHAGTVLTVAALADEHRLADYSVAAGPGSLAAPGQVAVGLDPGGAGLATGVTDPESGASRGFEGTSFAAPVVSGLAAALIERHPQAPPALLRAHLRQAAQPPHGAVDAHQVLGHLHVPADGAPGHRAGGAAGAGSGAGTGDGGHGASSNGGTAERIAAPVAADTSVTGRAAAVGVGVLAILALSGLVVGLAVGGSSRR
ncbi:S8 family serine peptidase [Corynebacterium frankenforstense]|uniref:S8 family serine peptidase n=1 Tax=Corynebacterium frankenforstense TaxID=1230998 RepID=UPI002550C571|nr:S8 family serine peptidase [Corynebacterium frankenforstense]MDK6259949.1 S8 family serine peptidase [Corynebacterium frankenforstense]